MISTFDLFSIGIGPSSSHTVGPMRAAFRFAQNLQQQNFLHQTHAITIELFGSLAHTGKGHSTDKAIVLGCEGNLPDTINPNAVNNRIEQIKAEKRLNLFGERPIVFDMEKQLIFNYQDLLPRHTNGMRFNAFTKDNTLLLTEDYYSIGGGFIICGDEPVDASASQEQPLPYPFDTAEQLINHCKKEKKTIAEIMMANELTQRNEQEIKQGIMKIINVMMSCIEHGCKTEGILPGGLQVQRRAPILSKKLLERGMVPQSHEQTDSIDWLNVYAIAVNEENAAGGRVVTAPTNGAAGIIPAVLNYYRTFYPNVTENKLIEYMLTAAAIAILYKKGASISAAEVGCQGEVGVASSMAAAALAAVLGGTVDQIASAAEIAMEHNLGLTCDPIAGLVQIPCIERNAIGAVKAVNVARLALMESGEHKKISLDKVIDTMRRTGHDMSHMYKETSLGGLAKIKVNVVEC